MEYPYACHKCAKDFSVFKPMADSGREEYCPDCNSLAKRVFVPCYFTGVKAFNAEYYPSLGKVIHNKRELNTELDKRNLTPIGNDFGSGEKMQKHYDETRERDWQAGWDKVGPE